MKFDSPDYQVLLVAEKYQTGYDQPLLHTMYVDIFARFMNERNFQNLVSEWISKKVYTRFRAPPAPDQAGGTTPQR